MNIPGYSILDKVAEGPVTEIFRAHHVQLDRIVLIKVFKASAFGSPAELVMLVNQAKAAANLKITTMLQIYDVAQTEDTWYVVSEYLSGMTLSNAIKSTGSIPEKKAIPMARTVAETLGAAWSKANVAHGHLTPDNIIMGTDGSVKICDFGLSRRISPEFIARELSAGRVVTGLTYMAPEVSSGGAQSVASSDMYSLGAILYHSLTGIAPFDGTPPTGIPAMHVSGSLSHPRDVNPGISLGASGLIINMMMKQPANRYTNWAEALADIKKVASGKVVLPNKDKDAVSTVNAKQGAGSPASAAAPVSISVPGSQHERGWEREREKPSSTAMRIKSSAPRSQVIVSGTTSTTSQQESVPKRRRSSPVPGWLNAIILFATLGTWAYLAFSLFYLPDAPPNSPLLPGQASVSSNRGMAVTPVTSAVTPVTAGPSDTSTTTAASTTTTVPPSQEQGTVSQGGVSSSAVDELKTALIPYLFGEQFDNALTLVQRKIAETKDAAVKKEMQDLLGFVREIGKTDELLIDGIRDKLNKRATIRADKQSHSGTIRAIAGNNILLAEGDPANPKTVTINISKMDPIDKSAFLRSPSTEARRAMKAILHMKGNDPDTAKVYASMAGPLSGVLTQQIESKNIPPSPPPLPPPPQPAATNAPAGK